MGRLEIWIVICGTEIRINLLSRFDRIAAEGKQSMGSEKGVDRGRGDCWIDGKHCIVAGLENRSIHA